MKKIRWHSVVTETLKTQASNFVLDPGVHWKPVECFKHIDVALACMGLRRTMRAA